MALGYTRGEIEAVVRKKGYAFFDRGDYNLNLIGIRSSRRVSNTFDDLLYIIYKMGGLWQSEAFPFTTDPGKGPMEAPKNPKGVAILAPGQYRGCWQLGMHKGTQEALVQVRPVKVYRDKNRDLILDYEGDETGMFGINIHWSSTTHDSKQVDNWSEGCQVGCGVAQYKRFIALLEQSAKIYGPTFTYTLLEAADFEEV